MKMSKMLPECIPPLMRAGISYDDASALRRASMQLHRWHEMECGDSNDHRSWCVTRGHKIGGEFTYDDAGQPFIESHSHAENKARYSATRDMERPALKRIAKIVAKYPGLSFYVQGDPRGCALYILRPGDVPAGAQVDSCYTRGLAVYK